MKKLFFCILALTCGTIYVQAQSSKDIYNERKEIRKSTKKELGEKATKTARKEAKKLLKEGWKTAPGALRWKSRWINRT